MSQAVKNRNKGQRLERYFAKLFREVLGFTKCLTSRQASRILDNSKVDLANIPYNVQIKNVKAAIKYEDVFDDMNKSLKDNFMKGDQQITYPKIIFHRRGRKKTQKFAIMPEEEFIKLLKKIHNDNNDKTS